FAVPWKIIDKFKKFFTPLQTLGMEKITPWRGRKFSLATKKKQLSWTNKHVPIKFYKISENNFVFILL
ncbi:MAG: hypothetical protein J6R54_05140, partial [Bacteroidaceae bacterium]|nr:hypothetical protein [Bacteroidaceae bacterium]